MKDPKETPAFDPDFSPDYFSNRKAAEVRRLHYSPSHRCYIDEDGCPILDRFGQRLG